MKTLILFGLATLFLTPSLTAQTTSDPVLTDTSYVVFLGKYKHKQSFEFRDVPYELVELENNNGSYIYFFGKFKTKCDATHAKNTVYLAGVEKSKVRQYIDYVDNTSVQLYACVCGNP
jgi:hypothetical protein